MFTDFKTSSVAVIYKINVLLPVLTRAGYKYFCIVYMFSVKFHKLLESMV